jgi:flagellin
MTSILTNVAAMAALQTLRGIDSNMEETQARVSSGLRVGTASDNAAYWSIATTMRSDNMALSAVQDALGLGAAKVDTAYAGMENAVEVVKEIRAKLVAATEDGVDKAKIQEEIEQLKQQLTSIATAASFSGENWLQADLTAPVTKSVVGSFVRDSSGVVSVKTIDYVLDGNSVLFDTVGNNGILDKVYDVSESSVTLSINTGASYPSIRWRPTPLTTSSPAARYSRATTPLPEV